MGYYMITSWSLLTTTMLYSAGVTYDHDHYIMTTMTTSMLLTISYVSNDLQRIRWMIQVETYAA